MTDTTSSLALAAETRFVDVHGQRIAYRRIGQGLPIVLANRLRGTLDTWDPLFLDHLAASHTVVTFDYAGIGYSEGRFPASMDEAAQQLAGLADALDLSTYVLAGWSWGGAVAQTLLVSRPRGVTHAVLIGTNPPGKNEHPMQPAFLERAFRPVNDLADEEVLFFEPASAASRAAAAASRARIRQRPDVDARIPSTPEAIQPYLAAAARYHDPATGLREQLVACEVPMLVLAGTRDTSTPGQNWFPLVARIPRALLVVLPSSGHAPQHQYPELAARYIADFIALERP